jgi:acetyltransferase-like isoleucine patch superfamily enzyme
MADLSFLWQNRMKFSITSMLFYRAWAKRTLSLPNLLLRNYRRLKLVRKGAIIDPRAEIGTTEVFGDKKKLHIGAYSFIGRAHISLHAEVEIGERVCINDGVELLTGSHDVSDPKWQHVKSKITIGDYAWIGTGALILPGVSIGRGAVIGARAVVSKSVDAGAIVVGNPAKPILKTRSKDLDYNPCEFLAANRAWLLG